MLTALIDEFKAADAAFRTACSLDENEDNKELWDAKEAAEFAVIRAPCLTIEDVRAKAGLALADENVLDTLANCTFDGEPGLNIFLRSLLGDAVEKSNNGEKSHDPS